MTFSTRRGRPPKPRETIDTGTPELRRHQALGVTAEPIDLCLSRQLISEAQHRSGLHLRWLYTVRYGAPSLTTHYLEAELKPVRQNDDPDWRSHRERDYHEARTLLHTHRLYEPVMRLAVYNERPAFLYTALLTKALEQAALALALNEALVDIQTGLELLARHWRFERSRLGGYRTTGHGI